MNKDGEWVKYAKDLGWWGDLKSLKGYLKDLEHDLELTIGCPWKNELKGDIETVGSRIKELGLIER